MYTQTKTQMAHMRPDLRLVARKAARNTDLVALPVGFSRRELQRLVADMID
ncbi:MAG: hypothetical protein NVV72_19770 [Asticcacaulis sp.]|nr:hypothetical protein [Asticcacaulis sp.]